jgi:outer membrane protein OmpA-like peptidoglycan-associated protein
MLVGAAVAPSIAFAGPQFTAQDIIEHFSKTENQRAAKIEPQNEPRKRGVFVGASGFGNEATSSAAANAASGDAPLVIPKTGAAAGNGSSASTQTASTAPKTKTKTKAKAKSSGSPSYAAAADAPKSSDAYDLLVTFRLGSDELTSQARRNLDEFAIALVSPELSDLTFAVDGHTDARGSESFNLDLSQRRAASVVRYLTSKGIAANRLVPTGYGESRPMRSDPFDPVNRRVETRRIDGTIACRALRC